MDSHETNMYYRERKKESSLEEGHLIWTFKERIEVFQVSKGRKGTPDELASIYKRGNKVFLAS